MMRIIDNFEEADELLWEELLEESGNGSVFQTPGFYRFLSSASDQDPFVFIGENNGRYEILLSGSVYSESNPLIKFVSRRAIVYGGIVTRNGKTDRGDLLIFLENVGRILKKKAIYLEIRNLHDYSEMTGVFAEAGFAYVPHLNFQVHITTDDEAFRQLNQSRRRQVKKSIASGAEIVDNPSVKEVSEFYEILKNTYRRKVRKPLPEEEFFLQFMHSGQGVFLLVKYESRIAGGIMCPVYRGKAIYEWYIAGDDGKLPGIYPSVLATWAAIEYAAVNGIKIFDFMGSGKPGEQYGVREFKSKFGGTMVENGRFLRIFNSPVYNMGKLFFSRKKRSS